MFWKGERNLYQLGVASYNWRRFTLSRSHHNAVVHGNDMIVFGGVDSGSVKHNDLWKLDLESKVWASLTPAGTAPAARIGASAVNYAFGTGVINFSNFTGVRTMKYCIDRSYKNVFQNATDGDGDGAYFDFIVSSNNALEGRSQEILLIRVWRTMSRRSRY